MGAPSAEGKRRRTGIVALLCSWQTLAFVQTLLLLGMGALLLLAQVHPVGSGGSGGKLLDLSPFATWLPWLASDATGSGKTASPVASLEREIAALREFARLRESLDADGINLLHATYLQRARSSDHLALQLLDLNEQLHAVQHRLAEAAVLAAVAEAAIRPPATEGAEATPAADGGGSETATERANAAS